MKEKRDMQTVLKKFISTDRQHRKLLEKQVAKGTLHRSQHRLLLYIARSEKAPTQKEIAEFFEISGAAVTVMLRKLEAAGYVVRNKNKSDMRSNSVAVTEKGQKILDDTKVLIDRVDEMMFMDFSQEELETFYSCLDKMQKNLSEFEKEE